MAHWETITHALHRAGGGPLRRVEFDGEFESDTAAIAGIRRALVHGLVAVQIVKSHGGRNVSTWTLTPRGRDWCMGRVALVRRSWVRVVEADEVRQKRIARLVADSTEAFEACTRLTPRQREILVLMTKGFTWQETATRLGITTGALSEQKSRICRHLGCTRTIEAAVIAAKAGIS